MSQYFLRKYSSNTFVCGGERERESRERATPTEGVRCSGPVLSVSASAASLIPQQSQFANHGVCSRVRRYGTSGNLCQIFCTTLRQAVRCNRCPRFSAANERCRAETQLHHNAKRWCPSALQVKRARPNKLESKPDDLHNGGDPC